MASLDTNQLKKGQQGWEHNLKFKRKYSEYQRT